MHRNGTLEPADEWSVLLGVHSQDGPLDGAHLRSVAAILVPHNYSAVELGADVALLRLASPARLSRWVRPVCLPRASHRFAHGTACWATGWGDVQEAGEWDERPHLHMWVPGRPKSWVLRWVALQKPGLRGGTQAELGRLGSDPRKIPNLPLCTLLGPRGRPTSVWPHLFSQFFVFFLPFLFSSGFRPDSSSVPALSDKAFPLPVSSCGRRKTAPSGVGWFRQENPREAYCPAASTAVLNGLWLLSVIALQVLTLSTAGSSVFLPSVLSIPPQSIPPLRCTLLRTFIHSLFC